MFEKRNKKLDLQPTKEMLMLSQNTEKLAAKLSHLQSAMQRLIAELEEYGDGN